MLTKAVESAGFAVATKIPSLFQYPLACSAVPIFIVASGAVSSAVIPVVIWSTTSPLPLTTRASKFTGPSAIESILAYQRDSVAISTTGKLKTEASIGSNVDSKRVNKSFALFSNAFCNWRISCPEILYAAGSLLPIMPAAIGASLTVTSGVNNASNRPRPAN